MENNNLSQEENDLSFINNSDTGEEEYTPKLFSEEQDHDQKKLSLIQTEESKDTGQLFEEDVNEEEDFEIPAFLRKQKF